MKRSIKVTMMVIAMIFIILYTSRYYSLENTDNSVSKKADTEVESKKHLENLKKYKERFARNEYHLERALLSVKDLKALLDTLDNQLYGNTAINLKILHHRSVVHLEEIIKSIKTYDEYPNLSEHELLDEAIKRLRKVDDEIIGDSLKSNDIYDAFDFTLNALAKAELKISESAFKTDQSELARLALKQAQLHIKNAFLLDYTRKSSDKNYTVEVKVFKELDSLIENESLSVQELDTRLTEISSELDAILNVKKK